MLDGSRSSDVVALAARNRANERMISHLNIQVRKQLSRMLNGSRSSDVVALEARNRANERTISNLNIQVR